MPYAVARIYAGSGSMTAEQLSSMALQELAPKLESAPGFVRYSTIAFSDGRFGSFSIYDNPDAARRGQAIAVEWVKNQSAMRGFRLDETLEGETGVAVQGAAAQSGRQHGVARIYKTDASMDDVNAALEQEGAEAIRAFPGLLRYTAVKLADGRVGIFSAFDTQENAHKSSQQAKNLRGRSGSRLARVLPTDPQVIEGTILGSHTK